MNRRCRALWSVLLALCSTPAIAANISVTPLDDDPTHAIVLVEGHLMEGDGAIFQIRISPLTKAVVSFDSGGGNVAAGIEIGKTIWLKSFMTVVLDGRRCASACALAWLGGTPRLMANRAYVGFHAAYSERNGSKETSGVGNALIGAYLNQLGLSQRAIVYATQAGPSDMTWLTLRDAERVGINVERAASLSRSEEEQALKKPGERIKQALPTPATQPNKSVHVRQVSSPHRSADWR